MIVKISGSGKSFKGLSEYLTHDPKARTVERVAWTHTHGLASDDVSSAVNEMYLTAENAELLKQEAGVRGGGRQTENPARHISLNWDPRDNPSQQHMIAIGEHFLRSMGWSEHQTIFIAHSDKTYKHVHLVINEVHPETGLRLNDDFEKRRVQKWAAAYEREQGVIRCEQRTLNPEDREKSMPRNMWIAFQQNEREFLRSEEQFRQNAEVLEYSPEKRIGAEWEIFKDIQAAERDAFYVDGRAQFQELRASIYREVKEEFREIWSDYYKLAKNVRDENRELLAAIKSQIIADQRAVLDPRRDAACAELKETRNLEYRELLDKQAITRAEFTERVKLGLDNAEFFHELVTAVETRNESRAETKHGFREATLELTQDLRPEKPVMLQRAVPREFVIETVEFGDELSRGERSVTRSVGAFFDALFIDLVGADPRPSEPDPDGFRAAAEEAAKQKTPVEYRSHDDEWRAREKSLYGRD
ncbi:relaxase/mobilization nuclease domain-containing protein [Bradyrhizobium genosp. A]|uniref:relaxase/mobilization nuclease domain-containing protein n=1 Tax=Bradyrhizobium genosp. A TaxID=83626 RepID=UPI003CF32DA5